MGIFTISVPFGVKYFFAVFNVAACAVLVILRVYHQRKQKIEQLKLSLTGLSSMLQALLCCCASLNIASHWYFGDIRWCDLSIKLATATYTLQRVILYIFIILRVEVVNQANVINPRLIYAAKVVIGVAGTFLVTASIVFSTGVADEHSNCSLEIIHVEILVPAWLTDTFICVAGTWMFIHPIEQILGNIENRRLRNMLWKTKIWSIVGLVSTLIATLVVGVIDGVAGIAGFNCSMTSLSLVMMLRPENHNLTSKCSRLSSQGGSVELRVKIIVAKDKAPSAHKPSTGHSFRLSDVLFLDNLMEGFISEDSSAQSPL